MTFPLIPWGKSTVIAEPGTALKLENLQLWLKWDNYSHLLSVCTHKVFLICTSSWLNPEAIAFSHPPNAFSDAKLEIVLLPGSLLLSAEMLYLYAFCWCFTHSRLPAVWCSLVVWGSSQRNQPFWSRSWGDPVHGVGREHFCNISAPITLTDLSAPFFQRKPHTLSWHNALWMALSISV